MNHWRDIPTEAALAAHLARRGGAYARRGDASSVTHPRPERLSPAPPAALQALFQQLQTLARQYGWLGEYTYNGQGDDAGLHVLLIRDVLLFAEVTLDKRLSPWQHHRLAALRRTGQADVYVWGPEDLEAIRTRLAQPRTKERT
jgi:hypothetical protein